MGKSILIIATPGCCWDCPLMDYDCADNYCNAYDNKCIDIPDTMGGKPDWCPIRPLPDYIEVCGKYPQPGPVPSYRIGWNACLDKITEDLRETKQMNTVQKIRVAKTKRNNDGQYKTLYKVFDEYGKFLYYRIGTDGEISECLEDFEELGYKFFTYRYDWMKKDRIQ